MARMRCGSCLALLAAALSMLWAPSALAATRAEASAVKASSVLIEPTGDHGSRSGGGGLWLSRTSAPPVTLPPSYDPTKPLCSYHWTFTWYQRGPDANGHPTYLFTGQSVYLSCQIETTRLDVQVWMLDPWLNQIPSGAKPEASCQTCGGPVTATAPDYDCAPCWVEGVPFYSPFCQCTLHNEQWTTAIQLTIVFEQPGLSAFFDQTAGGAINGLPPYNESCAGHDYTAQGDPYTWVCNNAFISFLPEGLTLPDGTCYASGGNQDGCWAAPPVDVPEVPTGVLPLMVVGPAGVLLWRQWRRRGPDPRTGFGPR